MSTTVNLSITKMVRQFRQTGAMDTTETVNLAIAAMQRELKEKGIAMGKRELRQLLITPIK